MHRKYWLLKWYEYMCNKANSNISADVGVDSLFVCPTPDGDIWDCEDCRYNRRKLEKEVMEVKFPDHITDIRKVGMRRRSGSTALYW